jgi:hypothetical protein
MIVNIYLTQFLLQSALLIPVLNKKELAFLINVSPRRLIMGLDFT